MTKIFINVFIMFISYQIMNCVKNIFLKITSIPVLLTVGEIQLIF